MSGAVNFGRVRVAALAAGLLVGSIAFHSDSASAAEAPRRRIAIEWSDGRPAGQIKITDGKLLTLAVARGDGTAEASGRFAAAVDGPFRLIAEIAAVGPRADAAYGPGTTVLTVETPGRPFSFFLRDATAVRPIYIPGHPVVVTDASDKRDVAAIAQSIKARGLQTKLARIESDPEESFDAAAAQARKMVGQTWLGLGRDMRIFAVGERLDFIKPRFAGMEVPLTENDNKPTRYEFMMGRGWGVVENITRRLEDGALPILQGTLVDEEVRYEFTGFVGLETQPLTRKTLRGTDFLVADGYGVGHMFTKTQEARFKELLAGERDQPTETVMFVRMRATNTGAVPRHAFFKSAEPEHAKGIRFDRVEGFGGFESGRVYTVAKLNGKPLASKEVAISLAPGASAELEMFVPHRPISRARATALRAVSFAERHASTRAFWNAKLAAAARFDVPEKRIDEMIRAGLLHLDLVTFGREPAGTLTATIGIYNAIGSESAPIIQFMDSMGWHDEARRALMYFLDKQHDNGFMQNFGGYMLETGATLWSIGEHYRYTRDDAWIRAITPKLLKACEFLRQWRQRNLREELRGGGYGMLEGKTADPEDLFRSFMLNGYAYLGLSRVAELLRASRPDEARRWQQEAEALKNDIRTAFFETMGRSPVIAMGDGTWSPTVAPWAEARGPLALYTDPGAWFTHGAMTVRDSLLGPMYLVLQEVIDAREPAATTLLNFHSELFTNRNTAYSQPYYSRQSMVHLMRGEVKPFLKAYYNQVASLADRQTYSFWEHYFGASPHKTHEEGWFLMETRWMLYREHDDGMTLLGGIPRAYLEPGKHIELKHAASHHGPLSLRVDATAEAMTATITSTTGRKPKFVRIRLPHPNGERATAVTGGRYDPDTEIVTIERFTGKARVTVSFAR